MNLQRNEKAQVNLGTVIGTESGSLIVNGFGFGVALAGKYTPAEIFNIAATHKPKELTEHFPAVDDWKLFNDYVWLPWSRLHRNIGESVLLRCRMHTVPEHSTETMVDYVGTKDSYTTAWPRYISLNDRLSVFTRFSKELHGVRVLDLGCGCGNMLLGLASYNMDVYGVESHPEMFNQRSGLLQDRILFGDALECLKHYKPGSFDVVIVSMAGNVWWHDFQDFLIRVTELVHTNGLVILDTLAHKHTQVKSRSLYLAAMREVGLQPKLKTESMLAGLRTGGK